MKFDMQKAIVQYYTYKNKAIIVQSYVEEDNLRKTTLEQGIKYCQKNNYFLIVAQLDRLALDLPLLFKIKKKLNGRLICCDLPVTDRLTLSTYVSILQRKKELHSIKLKAAFQREKAKGSIF